METKIKTIFFLIALSLGVPSTGLSLCALPGEFYDAQGSSCLGGYYSASRIVSGPYGSQALAFAAGAGKTYTGDRTYNEWTVETFEVHDSQTCVWVTYWYVYCAVGDDCWCDTDSDSDGIKDEIDPYPDNPDPFIYKVVGYQKNGQGETTFICIETHKGDRFCYGDYDGDNPETNPMIFSADNKNYDSTELGGTTGDFDIGLDHEIPLMDDYVPDFEPLDPYDMEDGLDNTGNSLDTDYLSDIVRNTQDSLKNQGSIGGYLKEISDDIKTSNQIAMDSREDVVVNVDIEAPTATDISDAIKSDLEDRDSAAESTTTDALSDISDGNETFDAEFDSGDKPDENLIADIYSDFMENNPVASYLNGSTIDTSSASCSFDWLYNGTNIEFSICAFQEQVSLVGTLLLGLAGIGSLLIVFRR